METTSELSIWSSFSFPAVILKPGWKDLNETWYVYKPGTEMVFHIYALYILTVTMETSRTIMLMFPSWLMKNNFIRFINVVWFRTILVHLCIGGCKLFHHCKFNAFLIWPSLSLIYQNLNVVIFRLNLVYCALRDCKSSRCKFVQSNMNHVVCDCSTFKSPISFKFDI